jgi:acyl-CoA reductase-like NAD-dependent aldehyde dehydrogenase
MGNSLVLKPSEYTCLSISYLAYLALEAGIPSGVLNVVHGIGRTVGSVLAHHKDVGLLSFTGSSATGKLMQIAAGQSNMKRLLLECGGKSPYIVFDDCPADLDMLADDIVAAAFHNQSQNCMAGSRLIIQSKIKETLLPKITEKAAQYVPQDTLDPSATFGALIHQDHMENVLSFIDSGKKQGARLIQGGNPVRVDTGKYSDGFYVEPTIFDEVKSTHKIAQEEIFGPVLATMEFDAEEEAIELANNSQYGLAAYVATMDAGRIQRVSQNVNAGSIMFLSTSAPSDVMKELGREGQLQSGFGAEGGVPGLLAYTLNTSVHHWT